MRGNRVVELDPWVTLTEVDELLGELQRSDTIGVVVKGSQGAAWTSDTADETLATAEAMGFLTGWLHYATPGPTHASTEAGSLLLALAARPLPLGVWIECDDLGGTPPHELGPWLTELFGSCEGSGYTFAVVMSPALYSAGVTLPPGVRLVLTGRDELVSVVPWATRVPTVGERAKALTSAVYELTSTRGLVPVGIVPPAPQKPPEDDVAPVGDPVEGETVGDAEAGNDAPDGSQVVEVE